MKRLTTRTLIDQRLGGRNNLTQAKMRRVLDAMRLDGWQPGYSPTPEDGDRVLVFLREGHPFAPLFKALEERATLPLPFSELQRLVARATRRDHVDLRSTCARDLLTRHGLILIRIEGEAVYLASSSPEFARYINLPRYSRPRRGFKIRTLLRDVLGMANEPKRVTEHARLAAAQKLDEFGIDASDLLIADGYCKLISNWMIDEVEFPIDTTLSLGGEDRHA